MKTFEVNLALCYLIAVAFAGQSILPNATHPDYPGKCYDSTSELVLEPDEEKSLPGACMNAYCSKDFSLIYTRCGSVQVASPDCVEIEQDFSQPYPECCRRYKCVIDGETNYL